MGTRTTVSHHDIIERYKKGERDFSNIRCVSAEFGSIVLAGAAFRNSDLSYSNFDHADLTGADFSGAILDWCSFRRTIMRKTDFTGARIQWAALNEAILENTIFRRADLSYSIMFNTNKDAADWSDANTVLCAFTEADLTLQTMSQDPAQIDQLKNKVPYDIWMRIKFSLQTVKQAFERQERINVQPRTAYSQQPVVNVGQVYGSGSTKGIATSYTSANLSYTGVPESTQEYAGGKKEKKKVPGP